MPPRELLRLHRGILRLDCVPAHRPVVVGDGIVHVRTGIAAAQGLFRPWAFESGDPSCRQFRGEACRKRPYEEFLRLLVPDAFRFVFRSRIRGRMEEVRLPALLDGALVPELYGHWAAAYRARPPPVGEIRPVRSGTEGGRYFGYPYFFAVTVEGYLLQHRGKRFGLFYFELLDLRFSFDGQPFAGSEDVGAEFFLEEFREIVGGRMFDPYEPGVFVIEDERRAVGRHGFGTLLI